VTLAVLSSTILAACMSAPLPDQRLPAPAPTASPSPAGSSRPDPSPAPPSPIDLDREFRSLEAEYGRRLGVFAVDRGSGATVAYREGERFAYASTMKALLVAAILRDVADLDRVIPISADDLVRHSPVTEKHVGTGASIRRLCEAAMRESDNAAANLLMKELGGPEGFRRFLVDIDDRTTRPVRWEPDLNAATPGDERDTSTPQALTEALSSIILGGHLPERRLDLLIDWMTGNATGDRLIRAGAPTGWVVIDKSGAGGYGTRNDLAAIFPPEGGTIFMAVMTTSDDRGAEAEDALVAEAAAVTLTALERAIAP